MVHEPGVDHRGLVHDHEVGGQGPIRIALEPPFLKTVFQEAVNGGGPVLRGLGHTFGRPPGGRRQMDANSMPGLERHYRLDDRRLTGSRTTGDDQHLGIQCRGHGRFLLVGEFNPQVRLNPGKHAVGVLRRHPALFVLQPQKMPGDAHLALVERLLIDGRLRRGCVGVQDQAFFPGQAFDSLCAQHRIDLQKRGGLFFKF